MILIYIFSVCTGETNKDRVGMAIPFGAAGISDSAADNRGRSHRLPGESAPRGPSGSPVNANSHIEVGSNRGFRRKQADPRRFFSASRANIL